MSMASLNLYIRDAAEPTFEKFRKMLEKENLKMSEVIADLVENYVSEAEAKKEELEEIKLEGYGPTRIFKGHQLYWDENVNGQTGVFLTAKGKIAYWQASNHPDVFEVYENLDELWEKQSWLDERRNKHIKQEIQETYIGLTNKPIVEHLDI